MKEQYVGDVNDYRKYTLLRHLAEAGGVRIGVCWMLTPADGGAHGNRRGYLGRPELWRCHKPEVFDQLRPTEKDEGARRLQTVERSGLIPDAIFFDNVLSDRIGPRRTYFESAWSRLKRAELIFFDPDNGVEVKSRPKGRAGSSKFIYVDEIAETYGRGHSVLVYQHFPMLKHDPFIDILAARLSAVAPNARLWCFRTPQVVFLLLIHPRHARKLGAAAEGVTKRWESSFMRGNPITAPEGRSSSDSVDQNPSGARRTAQ